MGISLDLPRLNTVAHPVRLDRHQVFILPTRYGYTFAIALLVMLFGSINYNNNLGYLLTFLLGSLMLVTILHTYRNLAGLTVYGATVTPVFAGDEAVFRICLDNRGSDARFAVALERWPKREKKNGSPRHPSKGESLPTLVDVPNDQLLSASVPVPAVKRGRLTLGRLKLSTGFPLGLFCAWSYIDPGLSCLVYPRPAGQHALPSTIPDGTEARAGSQAGTEDFLGFRHYIPGDSTRYIAWKAVARGQRLLIKRFGGSGAALWLSWANVAHLPHDEARLSQLCLWVIGAHAEGLRYSLRVPGTIRPLDHGEGHRRECLEALALYGIAS
ncbi:MAG: DUF58 domain-containing protein [Gammaproteobacteria bacterium]|nr:DUF58 domain-containing protein [Gammaproteobacteria bacterium]